MYILKFYYLFIGDNFIYLHVEVLSYFSTTSVELIPQSCPPGFIHSGKTKACVCSPFLKKFGITQCNIDFKTIVTSRQSWLGLMDNGSSVGYTKHCPPGYCLPNTTINIRQPDIMCRGNHIAFTNLIISIITEPSLKPRTND